MTGHAIDATQPVQGKFRWVQLLLSIACMVAYRNGLPL